MRQPPSAEASQPAPAPSLGVRLLRLGLLVSGLALLLLASVLAVDGQLGGSPARKVAARPYETAIPTPAIRYGKLTATAALAAPLATPTGIVTAAPPTPARNTGGAPLASAPRQVAPPPVDPPAAPAVPTDPPPAPTDQPPVFVLPPTPSCPTASMNSMAVTLFDAINNERTQRGLPALAVDACVVYVAQFRSDDMAANNYFSHTSLNGGGAFALLTDDHVPHGWAGENLARNNYPADEAMGIAIHDLMASPSHRDNILSTNYTALGVGYAYDGVGMHYFAMVFIGPP